MENNLSIEARRFKKVREEQKQTQQSFAQLLNVGATTADIERGKTKISGQWFCHAQPFQLRLQDICFAPLRPKASSPATLFQFYIVLDA